MTEYDASTYGENIAEVYDEWYGGTTLDTDAAVEFLAGEAADPDKFRLPQRAPV